MRWLLLAVSAVVCTGCGGFKAVQRGEWKLVWVDPARRDAEAPREVVTRERYESEVAEGNRRGWEPPPGFVFPLLHEVDTIGMQPGEVQGFRVDEATEAELFVDGATVEVFWGPMEKRDAWKAGADVTVRESALFLEAKKPGKATLRLIRGPQTKDVPVTVQGK
ncbi:MAG: hypothetical protein ACOZQL_42455 [Myxococcota bacterium]